MIAIAILRVDTAYTEILAISKLDYATMDVRNTLNLHSVRVKQKEIKTVENLFFWQTKNK